jgi:hypothetical protein
MKKAAISTGQMCGMTTSLPLILIARLPNTALGPAPHVLVAMRLAVRAAEELAPFDPIKAGLVVADH